MDAPTCRPIVVGAFEFQCGAVYDFLYEVSSPAKVTCLHLCVDVSVQDYLLQREALVSDDE